MIGLISEPSIHRMSGHVPTALRIGLGLLGGLQRLRDVQLGQALRAELRDVLAVGVDLPRHDHGVEAQGHGRRAEKLVEVLLGQRGLVLGGARRILLRPLLHGAVLVLLLPHHRLLEAVELDGLLVQLVHTVHQAAQLTWKSTVQIK